MMKCMPVLHLSALRGLSLPCCSVCLPALSLLVNLLLTLLCCSILLCSTYDNPLLQLFVSSLFLAGLISCVFSAWITRNWGRKVREVWFPTAAQWRGGMPRSQAVVWTDVPFLHTDIA